MGCERRSTRSLRATISRCTRPANRSPTEDQVSRLASPKKYVETPQASGFAEVSRASETNRSAPGAVGERRPGRSPRPGASAQRGRGQERLDADRHQPALDPLGEVVQDRVGDRGVVVGQVVPAADVDHHDLAAEVGAGLADPLLGAQRVGGAALDHRREPGQGLERGRAAGAVGRDAEVALELAHARLGLRAEVAVDAADPEPEVEQPPLQGVDVVAGHQVAGEVGQDPVAEPPAGLVEAAEGQRTDDAVDGQAALLLEGAYGELDALVVRRLGGADAGLLGDISSVAQKIDPLEQTDDLGDGGTGVPEPEDRVHAGDCNPPAAASRPQAMKSASSLSSAALGRAPTICLTTSPSL